MKKTIFKLLICLLGLPISLKAQLTLELAKKFPAEVVSKVFEINKKLNLSGNRQLELAAYFKSQDSLANAALLANQSVEKVAACYQLAPERVFTPLEYNDYLVASADNVSKLRYALKLRQELNLSKDQQQRLSDSINGFNKSGTAAGLDSLKQEYNLLTAVLKPNQYQTFLTHYYSHQAKSLAAIDWKRARKFNLVKAADSVNMLHAFSQFQLIKLINADRLTNTSDWLKADSLKKVISLSKPFILVKVDAYSGMLPKTRITAAIALREQLKLQSSQIDTLLSVLIKSDRMKLDYQRSNIFKGFSNKPYNGAPLEFAAITKTLAPVQLTTFLETINKENAAINTVIFWNKLNEKGLTKDLNRIAFNKEVEAYELKWLVANDLLTMDKSQRRAFDRQTIENSKPAILKLLGDKAIAEVVDDKIKNGFAW